MLLVMLCYGGDRRTCVFFSAMVGIVGLAMVAIVAYHIHHT